VQADGNAGPGRELGDRACEVRCEGRMAERIGARVTQRPIG
jgi:hypothetical protein